MNDDTISRQAVLRVLNRNMSNGFRDYNGDWWDPTIDIEAINEIKALPSAQQWIPVTKRLPEEIRCVIAQTKYDTIHEMSYEGKDCFGHEVWMEQDGGTYWDEEIVAWMPKPELWKGERNG